MLPSPTFVSLYAFLASLPLTAVIFGALKRAGVVDEPTERGSHSRPTIRGVGIVLPIGLLLQFAIWEMQLGRVDYALLVCAASFSALGFVDDLRTLRPMPRLVVMSLGSCLFALAVAPPALVLPVSFWLIYFTNAFNFMDGINGISGVHGALILASYAVVANFHSLMTPLYSALIVVFSIPAFLYLNVWRKTAFLGDGGSYFLGSLAAAIGAYLWIQGVELVVVLSPTVVYIVDTLQAIFLKVTKRVSLTAPHRLHVYQRLVDNGVTHLQVTVLAAFASSSSAIIGLLWGVDRITNALVWIWVPLVVSGYVSLPSVIARCRKVST